MKLTNAASSNVEICNKNLYKDTTIKGILFDMDGVILDTEKLYTRFWVEAAQSLGYPMTHEMALGMRSLSRQAGEIQLKTYLGEDTDYYAVRETRIKMMEEFIEENGVELKPGIHELLDFLKEHGIKTSIATSSPLDRTKKYLTQVDLVDSFDALVSGHMVPHGKPEPDIYIYAAENLGLKPEECVVLEDSPTGLLAAFRAGCVPVMVPDQDQPDEATKERVYAVVSDLLSVKEITS